MIVPPHGRSLDLERLPVDPAFQAWDQADLYVLDSLGDRELIGRILIVFDSFGALSCALDGRDRTGAGDSELSRRALRSNEERNSIRPAAWFPLTELQGRFDAAIVRIPRQKALLEFALAAIRPHLESGAIVVGAGMTRHIHNSTSQAFERWIGPTTTSRARSKARLIYSRAEVEAPASPGPIAVEVPGESFQLWVEPGVFARRGVDAGSALLLRWVGRLPDEGAHQTIADIGCGSGLLTAAAAARNPRAMVIGTDESHLAVRSATHTLRRAGFVHAEARVDDRLRSMADGSVDLVVSNPPQHQAAALSQTLLAGFIEEARRVLRPGGRVRMVANRHVNLNLALGGCFDRVRILDQDRRFMVCEAEGPLSAATRTP